jgi:hypothetical protein
VLARLDRKFEIGLVMRLNRARCPMPPGGADDLEAVVGIPLDAADDGREIPLPLRLEALNQVRAIAIMSLPDPAPG